MSSNFQKSSVDVGRCKMFDWHEVIVQQERRQELLREAERHRLVRQALAGRETQDRIHCRALTWLGRHLVAWGCFLERRYGTPVETAAMPAVNQCR